MAQTKKQQQEIKQSMLNSPPKDRKSYLFTLQGCPGYEGYIPDDLKHEVCKYCGNISYYH